MVHSPARASGETSNKNKNNIFMDAEITSAIYLGQSNNQGGENLSS